MKLCLLFIRLDVLKLFPKLDTLVRSAKNLRLAIYDTLAEVKFSATLSAYLRVILHIKIPVPISFGSQTVCNGVF